MIEDFTWDFSNVYKFMEKNINPDPLIITVAVNGGVQGKEANENIPETPDEIAESTYDAYNAGASIVHIHGRNPECLYNNICDAEVYYDINSKVRAKCSDIIINNSTGGGPVTTMEERINCLDGNPELASLNMGPDMYRFILKKRSENFKHPHEELYYDECTPFTYGYIQSLAQIMKDKGIKPEMEIYHPGQFWVSRELINKQLIDPPYSFQFVMGYQTSSFPTPENLMHLVKQLPEKSLFSTIGIGSSQWLMTTLGILLGGNVRVGLEDNVYLSKGIKLSSNAEAVEKIVRIAREVGRDIATPHQARDMIGISQMPTSY